jgi:hypothetical protein
MTPAAAGQPLTVADLQARWKLRDGSRIRALAASGALPAFRVGRLLRFRLDDVEAFERGGRREEQPKPRRRQARPAWAEGVAEVV